MSNRGILVDSQNTIINAVIVEDNYIPPQGLSFYHHETASIGWTFDGAVFLPPTEVFAAPPIPDLTIRQFMIALQQNGFITEAEARDRNNIPSNINAVFSTLPDSGAAAARITWALMTTIPRNDPMVDAIGAALNQTPEQIDDFFRQAALI